MQIVKVRLRKPTRVFSFFSRDVPLACGDTCIVRSDRDLEYGTCIAAPEDCSEEMGKRYAMRVVRKAHYNDQVTIQQILAEEEKAKALCQGKIQERNLPMQLADVEYSFDRRKAVFFFTAEDRVDFRDLVRDLAQDLKIRIELRHIQVRDKAKLVGALAACGRELCCATWMPDFIPISMKMAKRQNLSLNPSKISGQCGRLMCCLGYENDQYDKRMKRPAPESARKPRERTPIKDVEENTKDEDVLEMDAAEAAGLLDEAEPLKSGDEASEGQAEAKPDGANGKTESGNEPHRGRRRSRRRRKRKKNPQDGATTGNDGATDKS